MNPNNQPPKFTDTAKYLAKQVFPLVKNFVKEQAAARKARQAQQQQCDLARAPKQQLAARVEVAINRFLHRPDYQNVKSRDQTAQIYQQPAYDGQARQHQPYEQPHQRRPSDSSLQHTSPQRREVEIRECLTAHNEARRFAPGIRRRDLKWDERLATHAQRWAEHLIRNNLFEHDLSGTGEGENIYMVTGSGMGTCTFKDAIDAWNAEIVDYRGQKIGEGDLAKYGHYTQIIWPATAYVGMARVMGKQGKQIFVARYSPPGNTMGQTAYQ